MYSQSLYSWLPAADGAISLDLLHGLENDCNKRVFLAILLLDAYVEAHLVPPCLGPQSKTRGQDQHGFKAGAP